MQHLHHASSFRRTAHQSRVDRLRIFIGCGVMVATFPYVLLKINWILGGTLGMIQPALLQNATYLYANIATLAMDGVAVLLALLFTSAWGLRVPAALVLLPTWLATGFLLPIVVFIPLIWATSNWSAPRDDALAPWVYWLVYGGFAAQGVLLLAAFALYVTARWSHVPGRLQTAHAISRAAIRMTFLIAAMGTAAGLVGMAHLAWALGGTVGMGVEYAAQQRAIDHLTHGVYGTFACIAAVSVPFVVVGARWGTWVWLPLALGWAGTGSMFAWGSWLLMTAVVNAADAPGYMCVLLLEVLSAGVLASVAVRVLGRRLRSPRARVGGDACLPIPSSTQLCRTCRCHTTRTADGVRTIPTFPSVDVDGIPDTQSPNV